MSDAGYPRFCPVAMAASLLEPRWTLLVLCEMWSGSKRFSEIQRGVPGMSPALLSKRLRDMEANGLVTRRGGAPRKHVEYQTTPLADELEPVVHALGEWAHRNIDSEVSLSNLDARMLMWNIRRKIDLLTLPKGRCVIQFVLKEPQRETANYWLVAKPGAEIDLCFTNPKLDVDLFVVCELKALTSAWMGHTSFEEEMAAGRVSLIGDDPMSRTFTRWLVRSSYACVAKLPAQRETEGRGTKTPVPALAPRRAADCVTAASSLTPARGGSSLGIASHSQPRPALSRPRGSI